MQPSAPQDLPHTHARGIHWLSTAAAVAAVVAAGVLVAPADATQRAPGQAAGHGTVQDQAAPGTRPPAATTAPGAAPATAAPTAAPPDPAAATYPLTCAGDDRPEVVSQVSGDLDGDGGPETAVVVRCPSATGTPPSGVYVLSAPSRPGGPPRVAVTLVRPEDDRQILHFRLDGRQVKATVLGFSSDDVPRCCPDMSRTYTWEWRGDRYVALPGQSPNSV